MNTSKHLFGLIIITGIFLAAIVPVAGQVYSNKVVGKKNAELIDSLKAQEYPYALPIWGEKATKKGFNLPYSAGLGVNYLWQESDLVIENLQVGFNNRPMQDLSEVVRFDNATSEASGLNFRPDIWLFPFLNVYGIFAKATPSTTVDFGIYAPDSTGNWQNVISLNSQADFEATTAGFGITPTIGVGGGWFALDMNFTWSDIPELSEPAYAFIFGPRLGKTFHWFKNKQSNIAFWVGGFRLLINTGTTGSLPLSDVLEVDGLQEKVDNGIVRVDELDVQVETWWGNLSALEQQNPVNVAKYTAANKALEHAGGFLNSLDESLNDSEVASVQYALDKRPKDMWNFVVGSQFQLNKHWMIRAEYGFLGSRTQVIAGLQYRFGL